MPDYRELLKRVSIFRDLSNNDLERLGQRLISQSFSKEEVIFSQQEKGDTLFIVRIGKVKVTLSDDAGKEIILATFKTGDFFGEMSLIDNEPRSANVIAIEESEVLILNRQSFLAQIDESPRMSMAVMAEFCRRLRRADRVIGSLALLNVYGRIAYTLIDLGQREGFQSPVGIVIKERPTQQEIANMVSTTRETVSRALSEFQRRGFLEVQGKSLILKPSFSMDQVSEEGFSD